ncbi:M48 family metalloprotease [Nocardioides marinquilinus]|uniref:M48 family metalloprotease n=1 Tax=Nocardioides marinquilinus TaxID=1210400 RepID=UPI0031F19B61
MGLVVLVVLGVLLVPWDAVPGGPVEPVPAHELFTDAQLARAEAYSRWARVWSWSSLGVSLAVACWLGLSARGRRLVGRATSRVPGPWWLQAVAAVVVLTVVGRLLTLPFAVGLQRLRLDRGLTGQAWTAFATDVVLREAVAVVVASIGVVVVIGCARRWCRAWPAVVGTLAAALVVVGSFVYPVAVEPLFNDFEPLPDGPLRAGILELADREGVRVDDVLVADASRRTTTLNAYVSGFGGTRRVVVYDTLVETLDDDEALSVVAHELAHASHGDVVTGTVLGAAGAAAGVGLLALALGWLRRRGAPGPGEPAVVPVVLALVAVATLLAAPAQNAVSRAIETRADVDAVRATGDPDAFVAMQRRLTLRSLADPTPPALAALWFGTHPGVLTRVAVAERVGGR